MTVNLTEEQLEQLVLLVESGCSLTGPVHPDRRPILLDALVDLQAALDRFGHRRYVVMKRSIHGTRRLTPIGNEITTKDRADRLAARLNARAQRLGEQSVLLMPQSWETRYYVQTFEVWDGPRAAHG